MTGLSVARHLDRDACIFEKDQRLGGCLRSDHISGYTIDRTGHLLHFRDPYVRRVMLEELPLEWLHFKRRAEVHILGCRVPYPIQYHLHALPAECRVQCLLDYLDTLNQRPTLQDSFERWSRLTFGHCLHDLFFAPYNRKLWQTDLELMNAEWAERFVPMPARELVVRGALGCLAGDAYGYHSSFSYPRYGGSGAIVDAFAEQIVHPIHTGAELLAVDPKARVCEFSDGTSVRYRALVRYHSPACAAETPARR